VTHKRQEANSPKTTLAPALPTEITQQGLVDLSFEARDIRAVTHETELCSILFESHQLCLLHDWARNIAKHPIDPKDLVTLAQVNVRTVRRNLLNLIHMAASGVSLRPVALAVESESDVVAMLVD
jgi:hypothetical protein